MDYTCRACQVQVKPAVIEILALKYQRQEI